MRKVLSVFIVLLLCSFTVFADEFDFNNFGVNLKVGIKRMANSKVYVKAEQGAMIIEYKSGSKLKKDIISSGKIVSLTYSGGKIRYNNNYVSEVKIFKKDMITLFALSKNKSKYSRYRGEFEFLVDGAKVLPINLIRAEEYLYSVVPSEIGFSFPDEAIKAQAVAARSYLYYSLKNKKFKLYDLEDSVTSQVYLGYDRESDKITKLINETENEVMLYEGKPINALFHSTSGGKTANSEDVWGSEIPYLRAVNDKGNGAKSPRQNWSYSISKTEFSKKFGFTVKSIKIVEKKDGRAKKVQLSGSSTKIIDGNTLRSKVGYSKIHSTMLEISSDSSKFYFKGHGSGHGVGMPQWSAYGLAEKGKDYEEILKYFYTGIKVSKLSFD